MADNNNYRAAATLTAAFIARDPDITMDEASKMYFRLVVKLSLAESEMVEKLTEAMAKVTAARATPSKPRKRKAPPKRG